MCDETSRGYRINADEVNRLRIKAGLNWESLASKANFDPTTLRRWRKLKEARIENIKALAGALDRTVPDILHPDDLTRYLSANVIAPSTIESSVRMLFRLDVEGWLPSLDKAKPILLAAQEIMRGLAFEGMAIDSHRASLTLADNVTTQLDDVSVDIHKMIVGLMVDGTCFYTLAVFRTGVYHAFVADLKQNEFDLRNFHKYGMLYIRVYFDDKGTPLGGIQPPVITPGTPLSFAELNAIIDGQRNSVPRTIYAGITAAVNIVAIWTFDFAFREDVQLPKFLEECTLEDLDLFRD